jgi:hypothetical protein
MLRYGTLALLRKSLLVRHARAWHRKSGNRAGTDGAGLSVHISRLRMRLVLTPLTVRKTIFVRALNPNSAQTVFYLWVQLDKNQREDFHRR